MMKRRQLVLAAPAFATASLGAGWHFGAAAQASVIKFGQSASLTGGQAHYGADVRDGILAAFALAAAEGGAGPRFELVSLDDGGDKEKCKANVQTLIDAGVVSLIGLTSGAAAEASLPMIEKAQIPLLATASGNMGIRAAKLTMPFQVRAGYSDEYQALARYFRDFGMKRIGYVYLADTSPANQTAMNTALDAVGIQVTVSVPLDRNAKTYDEQIAALMAQKLDCILFTTNASPIVGIVRGLVAKRFTGMYFSSSFAGQALFDEMAKMGQVIVMSQVVPRPNSTAVKLVKRYQASLEAFDAKRKPGYTSLEGYIAGGVAIEAARVAGRSAGAVTRQRFKESLASLSLDLGGYAVRMSPGNPNGSKMVDIVAIDRTGRLIG